MNCSHKGKSKRVYGFEFNPFELAICGPSANLRTALVAQVAALFQNSHTTAIVMDQDAEQDSMDLNLGVNLVRGSGQNGLLYPASMDDYLGARPLLDSDIVLVDSAEDSPLPKVVWVEDGELPRYTNVLAYVYDAASCPILPSTAPAVTLNQLPLLHDILMEHFTRLVEQTPLYGLVLAGGRSTRMASDKGLIDYHGKPQVQFAHDLLSRYCDSVFLSVREEQGREEGYRQFEQIPDAFLGFGPLGGILSAQKAHPDAAWLVLACDLPYVTTDVLEQLLREHNPFKLATAFTSAHDGFPEPLCAIYEPKSIFRLIHFLALGYHCPRKVLINSDTCLVTPSDLRALDNVNNPAERDEALKLLSGAGTTPA